MQSISQILMKCVDSLRNGDDPLGKDVEKQMPIYPYSEAAHPYPRINDEESWKDYRERQYDQGQREWDDLQQAEARREEIRRYLNPPCAHDRVRVEADGEVYCANRRCKMYLGYRELRRQLPTQEELGRL